MFIFIYPIYQAKVARYLRMSLIAEIILAMLSFVCKGQDIPKGATGIEIITTLSDSALFEQTVSVLLENGYSIANSDSKRGFITTDNRGGKGLLAVRLLAIVKKSVVRLKAEWSASAMGYSFTNEPVRWKGMKGGGEKQAFLVLQQVADQIKRANPTATIQYILP